MNRRAGYSPEVRERENRELKRANKILKKAVAFFAQAEFDRKPKWWSLSSTKIVRAIVSSQSVMCCRLHRLRTIDAKTWNETRINVPIELSVTTPQWLRASTHCTTPRSFTRMVPR